LEEQVPPASVFPSKPTFMKAVEREFMEDMNMEEPPA